jgi:hypothetical protein
MTEFVWFAIYFGTGMGIGIIVKWIYLRSKGWKEIDR